MDKMHKSWTFDSMVDQSDDYYRCCLNTHVNKYVYGVSVVGVLTSALAIISTLCAAQFFLTIPPLILLFVFAVAYVGNHQSKPLLYGPLIITQLVLVFGLIGLSVYLVSLGSTISYESIVEGRGNPKKMAKIWIGIIYVCSGLLVLLLSMFLAYLTQVIFRAYSYLKEVVICYDTQSRHDKTVDF
ncbi:hypothetical protein M3Y98_00644400 [Aphelenchoides besseyi]|nr:hypothetical protein M3Y98_00644400 [Aphelenchoides besseyi]KAI6208605.1 hypothetical protein M3Y96_00132800 [Aphelenchoides besseyi]